MLGTVDFKKKVGALRKTNVLAPELLTIIVILPLHDKCLGTNMREILTLSTFCVSQLLALQKLMRFTSHTHREMMMGFVLIDRVDRLGVGLP
eukprot:1480365-Rhodomonas_salina.1